MQQYYVMYSDMDKPYYICGYSVYYIYGEWDYNKKLHIQSTV